MPHLVVEYSHDLPNSSVLKNAAKQIFSALAECGVFQPDTITIRMHACAAYQSGTQDKYFIHNTLYLYEGRTPEQFDAVVDVLKQCLSSYSADKVNITLRIEEMKHEHYIEIK